jgi:hypothetical protein
VSNVVDLEAVPLLLKDAARLLGIRGAEPTLYLRRRLEAYQHETGETVLIGNGKTGAAARYRVTLRNAQRCLRRMQPAETEAARQAREHVEQLLSGVRGELRGWLVDAIENLRGMSGLEAD